VDPLYNCNLCLFNINSSKDLPIYIDTKLHFHNHVNRTCLHCVKLLGLVRDITFNFSPLEYTQTIYCLVRSVVWNSVTSTDENQDGMHLAEVCGPQIYYSYFHAQFTHVKASPLCITSNSSCDSPRLLEISTEAWVAFSYFGRWLIY
jgi:hypothetical protein